MKTEKTTLADKIAGILNSAPTSFDPEDETADDTYAQVVNEEVDTPEDEEILSKFRRANVDLLADVDEKYAGKKTSRKNLKDSDSDDSDVDEDQEDIEDDKDQEDTEDNEDSESDIGSQDIATTDDEDEESEDDGEMLEEDDNFKHLPETNVSNQVKKGICVRNQMTMWENLLEARIQLQKCLIAGNKMPLKSTFDEMKQSNPEFSNKVSETKAKLCGILDKFLTLQKLLLKQFPETKNLGQENEATNDEQDDEIIESDTDEGVPAEEEEETEAEPSKVKRRKVVDYEEDVSNQHKIYKNYRNKVIQRWNDKTRVVIKGGATSHSVLDQIEYNLSQKEKLIKRTQTKRSQYTILGRETNEEKNDEETNPEIFDDDDFYHQLLRELIEVKSADVTDPVQLGRQWIQLQSLRSKMKRKIDTRATKGRKIRYAVHNKLVNFMASIDSNLWTDEAKNELYNSLFGKNQPVFNV